MTIAWGYMQAYDGNNVDRTIGNRLRARRIELGLVETEVETTLGLPAGLIEAFESCQKPVDVVVLFALAQYLKVPIEFFFARADSQAASPTQLDGLMASPEGPELAERFPELGAAQRQKVLALVRALHDEEMRTPDAQEGAETDE